MSTQTKSNGPVNTLETTPQRVDWRDFRVLFLCVGLWIIVHAINALAPDWNTGDSLIVAPAVALVGYIFLRARTSPEKLKSWGITTPLTFASISVFAALLVSGILLSGLIARQMGNELRFQPDYLFRMLEYFPSGFTQQFFLCSVLLVSLETVPALKGTWRLPLLMGILFGAVHLHSPFYITGFPIPPVAVGTFFLGFIATWYFLRFRNMIPLACLHAIGFVLFVNWIETPQNLQTPISAVEKNMDSDRRMTWWQKPGLGVCYSVEHQPGWNWDRNFVKYNKEFSDEHGKLKFRGPHWKVEEWIAFSKELGVDFHMAQTKWCDGICFFETELTDWKSPEDYVEKFARMSREARIPFSLYYSTIFDHNPQFDHIQPRKNFLISGIGNEPEYVEYVLGQYRELAEQYRPDSIWLDWYDDTTEATRSSIAFIRNNYPDIALGYNQSHNSKKAREILDYTSWEGHFLYKLPELNVLQNNLRKEWRTVARILDPIFSPIFIRFKKSTWDQANRYRREFDHPWDLTSPVGLDWQAPELRDDSYELIKIAAVIMACGGRTNLWGVSRLDGTIRPEHLEQLRMVGDWYRPRKDLFREARTMKYDGDSPPGIDGLPEGYGAIASKLDDDVLIHIIRLEGDRTLTNLEINESDWPETSGVFLEPGHHKMNINRTDGKVIVELETADVDPVDTILRMKFE